MGPRDIVQGWTRFGISSAGLGVVCAFIGPFGTFADLSLDLRLVYWLTITAVNGAQVVGALALAAWLLGERWPPWAIGLAASALASIPATAEVLALEHWLRHAAAVRTYWGETYLYVFLLTPRSPCRSSWCAACSPGSRRGSRRRGSTRLPGATLMRRLKPELRGELWALEMEDHYLRVHTERGNDLILYRLSDAIAEVGHLEGRQVHRSYWVARAAITGTEREGRRVQLILKNASRSRSAATTCGSYVQQGGSSRCAAMTTSSSVPVPPAAFSPIGCPRTRARRYC